MAMKRETVVIGPEYARKLLDANDHNRKPRKGYRERYANDMRNGEWYNIGDPIRVGTTGRLLDGQQRLLAVEDSETEQEFDLITGIDEDLQKYMDTGAVRTPGDVFYMQGHVNASQKASAARMIVRYKDGTVLASNSKQTPIQRLTEFADDNPKLTEAVIEGNRIKRNMGLNPTVVATVYYLASEVATPFEVNYFFQRLYDGMFMTPGNPIAAFKQFANRRTSRRNAADPDVRTDRNEWLWYLVQTWNNWAQGESVSKIQLPKGGLVRSNQFKNLLPVLPGVIPESAREEFHTPTADNAVIHEGGDR